MVKTKHRRYPQNGGQETGFPGWILRYGFGRFLSDCPAPTRWTQLAKHVKNINPKVNIIFLTVCDEREHAREVLRIKPSGYLVKPAKKEQLEFELKNLRYCAR